MFNELFKGRTNRLQMIGVFLGMLELMKSELIWVEQSDHAGDIRVRAMTDVPAEQAVQEAIYKNQEEQTSEMQDSEFADEIEQYSSEDDEYQILQSDMESDFQEKDSEVDPQNEFEDLQHRELTEKTPQIPIQQLPPEPQNDQIRHTENHTGDIQQ